MVRTPSYDGNGRKKGTWTPEEDRKLTTYITKYGCWNWRQLPKYADLARCGKSCRLRWMNYLRPNVKRGNYTKEEDEIILNLHAQLGNKWSAIAVHLPGRSDNEIKNHWHTALKKRATNYAAPNSSKKCINKKKKNASPNVSSSHENIVLESSEWSPNKQNSSSDQELSSYSTIDYQQDVRETKVLFEEEVLAETSGNFWTEPFLVDSFSTTTSDLLVPCELVCPPSPFITHDSFLSSFDFDHYY